MLSRTSLAFSASLLCGLFALSTFSPTADAGPRKRRENRQVQKAEAEKADDKRDVHQFKNFLSRVQELQGKPVKMTSFDARVLAAMGAEKAESRREMTADTREIKGDRVRKRHRKGPMGKPKAGVALQADKADRRAEGRDLGRMRALKARYQALKGKAGAPAVKKKMAILKKVIALNKNEVRKDKGEIKENRRERRRAR
ncbi:MAG: hypothetical protein GY822_27810 [Deltaproteobacteria bacterium]|nr:hypothetical protein [Deltaproteobacteria bacterium]